MTKTHNNMLKRILFSALLALSSYTTISHAQVESAWTKATKESNQHFDNTEYEKALTSSQFALKVAKEENNKFLIMTSLSQISWDYRALEQFAKAEFFLRSATALESNMLPSDHPVSLRNSVMLAEILILQKNYADAKSILQKTVSRLEKKYRREHEDFVAPLTLLSTIAIDEADLDSASRLIERALNIHKKIKDARSRFTDELLENERKIHKTQIQENRLTESKPTQARSGFNQVPYSMEEVNLNLLNCFPEYPREAFKYQLEGKVTFEVEVNVDGAPTSIKLLENSGWKILDNAAINKLASCYYFPATIGGNPISRSAKGQFFMSMGDAKTDYGYQITPGTCNLGDQFLIVTDHKEYADIKLRFLIGQDGLPFEIRFEDSSEFSDINELATSAIRTCRFKATKNLSYISDGAGALRLKWVGSH